MGEFALGFYLVHNHFLKYDNASQDAIYQTEELIAQVVRSFSPVYNNLILQILDKLTENARS